MLGGTCPQSNGIIAGSRHLRHAFGGRQVVACTVATWASSASPPVSTLLEWQASTIFGEGSGSAPPAKSHRLVDFLEAAAGPSRGHPAPKKDDCIMGSQDEFGMAPKIAVGLEGELESLNVEPLSMDRDSDSPCPLSPAAEVVLTAR